MNQKKSEQIPVALIGGVGAIIAALIGAFALIYVNKKSTSNRNDNSVVVSNININRITDGTNANIVIKPSPPLPTATPTLTPTPTPTPEKQNTNRKVTLNGVEYELVEVRFEGKELYFWFLANNQEADKEIYLSYASNIIDADGNPHRNPYRITGDLKGGKGLTSIRVSLPHRTPVRFGLAFDTVTPEVTSIPFLEVILRQEGTIQIRDIPIPYNKAKK